MKVRIWGCRGSIPRPNPEMARYGGNTPCVEVRSSTRPPPSTSGESGVAGEGNAEEEDDDDDDDDAGGGHRIILDLGSGAFDLGHEVLREFFGRKQKQKQKKKRRPPPGERGGGGEGEGTKEEGKDSKKFGGSILITHTHWDHIQGLPFFVPLYLPQFEWTIYGPRGVAKSLHEALSGQMQHDYFPVRLDDMRSRTNYQGLSEDVDEGFWLGEEDDAPTSIKVTSKYLNHSVLTLGYKLEEFARISPSRNGNGSTDEKRRATRGASVAYITDHEPFDHSLAKGGFVASARENGAGTASSERSASPDEAHAEFFRGVDVLLHDCQYYFREYAPESAASKEYWGHSTVEYVVEVAFRADVKRLLLFHHDPQRSDEQMDELVRHARAIAEGLEKRCAGGGEGAKERVPMIVDAAKEGDVYDLDPFAVPEADDANDVRAETASVDGSSLGGSLSRNDVEKQTVLLGLQRTDPKPLLDVLRNSEAFDAKVLENSDEILRYAEDEQPAAIVLDERLAGSLRTGFEVCEEIRSRAGTWGEGVTLMVIASAERDGDRDGDASVEAIADRLNLEDYIRGPFSPSYLLTRIQVSLLRMPLRWRRAPFSKREDQRLATLRSTGLLDTAPEERFDRITRLCSAMFRVPMSLVSLVDEDRQWFKSNVGIPGATQTPRDHAFCAHAILEDDGVMVVPDALQDARFADNPLVTGAPNVRFYAGCPIKVAKGDGDDKMPIGTLCVIDSKPRDLQEEELNALRDFGAMVENEVSNSFKRIKDR